MSTIAIKLSDSYPPMINRFKIISKPKTMEPLKIKNNQVLQHAFKVPDRTESILIESELNRSWPLTRQLRSSIGSIKVRIDQIKVRGIVQDRPNPSPETVTANSNHHPERMVEKEVKATVPIEVNLVEGINLVEVNVIGKLDGHKSIDNHHHPPNLTAAGHQATNGIQPNGQSPHHPHPLNSTSSSSGVIKESYRLFIFR